MAIERRNIFRRIVRLSAWAGVAVAVLAIGWVSVRPAVVQRRFPDRIPVYFWHMWTEHWADVVNGIVASYNASQAKYEVIPLSVPSNSASGAGTSNASEKMLLAIAGGDPPDCIAQWNPVLPAWADQRLILPLDEVATPEELQAYRNGAYPIAIKVSSYHDRLYALAMGFGTFALYYNTKQLRAAGLDPRKLPESIPELFAWRDKLTRRDANGTLTRIGLAPFYLNVIIPLFGDDLYDPITDGISLHSEAMLGASQMLYRNNAYYGFDDIIRFLASVSVNNGGGASGWPFMSGQFSIALDGAWRVEQLARYAPDMEYVTGPMPSAATGGPMRGFGYSNFMVIPTGARCPAGAWDFMKYWSGLDNPERAAEFYVAGGWLPSMRKTGEAPAYRRYLERYPQFETFLNALGSEALQPPPPVVNQVFLGTVLQRVGEYLGRGSRTPEEAMWEFEKEIQDEARRRKELHP
jgi:multiple sugar transport system substrate-binding protein